MRCAVCKRDDADSGTHVSWQDPAGALCTRCTFAALGIVAAVATLGLVAVVRLLFG
jgi:hypothetical protein